MRRFLVPVALFLIAVPAAADAPTGQYGFFDARDQFVHDLKTGLDWNRFYSATGSFNAAKTACLGGFSTGSAGRVPTIKELMTIFDEEPHKQFDAHAPNGLGFRYSYVDTEAFKDMRLDVFYWSSTDAPGGQVWTLDFGTGAMTAHDKTGNGAVRCVR